jgi:putative hydrolase of the HAD superfamily
LGLRAVIFDYGMVLTGPPDPVAHAELERITGLPAARLDSLYWADRQAYDEGKLTGSEFWRKLTRDGERDASESMIEELNRWDARMWTTENPAMLEWQTALKKGGFLTAIVSNMGDAVLAYMETKFDWLARFDVLVWSFRLRVAKPDLQIYRYVLEKLGTRPEETLFIDDKQENVAAAIDMRMKGIVFSNVQQLRDDLIALKLDQELPLPCAAGQ